MTEEERLYWSSRQGESWLNTLIVFIAMKAVADYFLTPKGKDPEKQTERDLNRSSAEWFLFEDGDDGDVTFKDVCEALEIDIDTARFHLVVMRIRGGWPSYVTWSGYCSKRAVQMIKWMKEHLE